MNNTVKILGICGSLRKGSWNRGALRAAVELAPKDAVVETFDIRDIPPFDQDHEKDPPSVVAEFKKKIRESDAVLFVSPEYNYSVPGVLKNAIDWASRPYGDSAWDGKPGAIIGASGGNIATARMQYHLRQICVFLNIHLLNKPEVMIGNSPNKFDEESNLTDETSREMIAYLLEELVRLTRQLAKD
jgi:chromate reductase